MFFATQQVSLRAVLATAALLWAGIAAADPSIPVAYCATVNTASTAANNSIYQTEGLCHDFCNVKGYALAVVQYESCWCSNYVPNEDDQLSTSKCANQCPGFPDDVCGGDTTYGYLTLAASPKGTAGVSATAQTSKTAAAAATSSVKSVTSQASSTSQEVSTSSSSSTTSTSTSSTSSSATPAAEPTVRTVTVGGSVQTVTATPTAVIGSPSTNNVTSSNHSGGLSTGQAVGLAIGMVALAVIVAGGFVFWCLRRRRRQQAEEAADLDVSHRGSSAGIMQTPKSAEMGENPQFIFTSASGGGEYGTDALGRRRSGFLRPMDPRLDPGTAGIYNGENRSHDSINTLRDDQDYSRKVHHPQRVLRATNPDPDDE